MTSEADLRAAILTAHAHCRPGGVAVLIPDDTAETYEPETDHGGTDGADGRAVALPRVGVDPDPDDTWTATEYAFLLREADGSVRVVHETHRTGLFSREIWLRLIAEAGFEAECSHRGDVGGSAAPCALRGAHADLRRGSRIAVTGGATRGRTSSTPE